MNLIYKLMFSFLLLSVSTLHAQFEKGTIQLGIDGAANLVIGDEFGLEDWVFMPEGSYFLFDNFSLGLSGYYQYASNSTRELTDYNIGILSRYYFYQKGAFSLNIENYLGLGELIGTSENNELFNFRFTQFRIGIGLGMSYYVVPRLALTFGIRGNRDFEFNNSEYFTEPVDFRFGLRFNLNSSK